jgi:hypothetical protein
MAAEAEKSPESGKLMALGTRGGTPRPDDIGHCGILPSIVVGGGAGMKAWGGPVAAPKSRNGLSPTKDRTQGAMPVEYPLGRSSVNREPA